jgi:hypothetical protein
MVLSDHGTARLGVTVHRHNCDVYQLPWLILAAGWAQRGIYRHAPFADVLIQGNM